MSDLIKDLIDKFDANSINDSDSIHFWNDEWNNDVEEEKEKVCTKA